MLSTCYTTQRTNIFREPLVRLSCVPGARNERDVLSLLQPPLSPRLSQIGDLSSPYEYPEPDWAGYQQFKLTCILPFSIVFQPRWPHIGALRRCPAVGRVLCPFWITMITHLLRSAPLLDLLRLTHPHHIIHIQSNYPRPPATWSTPVPQLHPNLQQHRHEGRGITRTRWLKPSSPFHPGHPTAQLTITSPVNDQLITRMPGRIRDGNHINSHLVGQQLLERRLRLVQAHPKRRLLRPGRRAARVERTSTHVPMPRAMGVLQRLRLRAMRRVTARSTLAKRVCTVQSVIKPLREKTIWNSTFGLTARTRTRCALLRSQRLMRGGRWLVPARRTLRLPTSATSVNPWRQLSGLSQGLLRRRPKGTQCGFPRTSTLFAVYYTPSFFCWFPCAWPLLCGVIRFCQFGLFLDVYCGFPTCVFYFLFFVYFLFFISQRSFAWLHVSKYRDV